MATEASELRRPGLRERKKQRTRQTIVAVATSLFVEHGYAATTVSQIADAAEVSLSTIYTYFATKADLVFSLHDAVIDSAEQRILGRPPHEPAERAVVAWIRDDLAVVEAPFAGLLRESPAIVASDAELQAAERLRMARLEDVLATAFARDLAESPAGLRPRALAAIALRGMMDAWGAWFEQHRADGELDLQEAFAAKSDYIERLLTAALVAIESLPRPG